MSRKAIKFNKRCRLAAILNSLRSRRNFIVSLNFALFLLVASSYSRANREPVYEEISVFLSLPAIGGLEVSAAIREQEIYLPLTDIFNFLKINNTISPGLDTISGFFIQQKSIYLIDVNNHVVSYEGKQFELKPEHYIRTETNVYFRSDLFGNIFGLHCKFNFRSLSVQLDTKLEVPAIREMWQDMMRRNLKKLKGDEKADTIIGRHYSLFSPGMIDWSIVSTQKLKDVHATRFSLRTGMMLAGGEATVAFNLSTNAPFQHRQQFYQWRFVNNDFKKIRQVTIGNIAAQATSSILSPVAGIQITNSPTTYRQSFGTYTLTDKTQPEWTVELYVNNVLLDYTKADASGFFTFNVPLMYGNTNITLRFYGPSGEERTSEQNISVPFNFLPKGEFEYSLNAGFILDTLNSRYSRLTMNYGMNRRMTIGGGVEYLSSVSLGEKMPFLNTTLRFASSVLVSGEYTYGVRSKVTASYRLPSNFQLEFNCIKYTKGQQSINNNFLEERKMSASMPLKVRSIFIFSRVNLNQFIVPATGYASIMQMKYRDIPKTRLTTGELLISGAHKNLNANLLTNCGFPSSGTPDVYTNFSFGYQFSNGLSLRPQVQYSYTRGSFITMKYDVEKRLSHKGFINVSYEKIFMTGTANIQVGMRYDLSYLRSAFSVLTGNKTTTLMQSASGSVMYDEKTRYAGITNTPTVGKGGLTLVPFLDLNGNGKKDIKEPQVSGLKFRINGGRVLPSKGGAIIRVINIEPFVNYLIELDANSLGNFAWQIKKKNISVAIEPSSFKLIEIPVSVLNEVSGVVLLKTKNMEKGLSNILVNIYDSTSKRIAQVQTESDGYFSYLGLSQGSHTARVDDAQLKKLNLECFPGKFAFTIAGSEEGVVADGFKFVLKSRVVQQQ